MKKSNSFRYLFIPIFALAISLGYAVEKNNQDDKVKFELTGNVRVEKGSLSDANIKVTKNGKDVSDMKPGKNGKFSIRMDYDAEYVIQFTSPGHFPKRIHVSTQVPLDVWERDNEFPAFPIDVRLFEAFDFIDPSFSLKPVGKIYYSKKVDNFDAESYQTDVDIQRKIEIAKVQHKRLQLEENELSNLTVQEEALRKRDFDKLIAEADRLYNRGEYSPAIIAYREASSLFPSNTYPKDRIAEIEDLLSAQRLADQEKEQQEKKFSEKVALGDQHFDNERYTAAKDAYQEALAFKPNDVGVQNKIAAAQRFLDDKETRKAYQDLIDRGDAAYSRTDYDDARSFYNKALGLLPDEEYPARQLEQIGMIEVKLATDKKFDELMAMADKLFKQGKYDEAIAVYEEAKKIKADATLPQEKIEELRKLIEDQARDRHYAEAINRADNAFKKKVYFEAKGYYQEALRIKEGDDYANKQITTIDDILAEQKRLQDLEEQYNTAIARADNAFKSGQFEVAKTVYNEALTLKPNEKYPKDQLVRIEQELIKLAKARALEEKFNTLVAKAKALSDMQEFQQARDLFASALELKPKDKMVRKAIDDIDKILAQMAEERRLEEEHQRQVEEERNRKYQDAIDRANKLFKRQEYGDSKLTYAEAINIKEDEEFPFKMINKIDSILADQERELIAAKKRQEEYERSVREAKEKAYNLAVHEGDSLFNIKEYATSTLRYQEASHVKPDEQYPKQRIEEIKDILEQIRLNDEGYMAAIDQANKAFKRKELEFAREKFKEALTFKPEEDYPKRQIQKIDDYLAQLQEQNRIRVAYEDGIALADSLYHADDLTAAKDAYLKASEIKPDEKYPATQIRILEDKIAERARLAAEMKVKQQAYDEAIAKGDAAMSAEDFIAAKVGYNEALAIFPDKTYPQEKIAEIDKIFQQKRQAREAQYNDLITQGDEQFKNELFNDAKASFERALEVKQNDRYATRRLNETLAMIDRLAREEQERVRIENEYAGIITRANELFKAEKFNEAKGQYQNALKVKPLEQYPKDQIAFIDQWFIDQENAKQLEVAYNKAVERGDSFFGRDQLNDARSQYVEASNLKPDQQYPVDKIAEIDSIFLQRSEAERIAKIEAANAAALKKATDEKYAQAIEKADIEFRAKNLEDAKALYEAALAIYNDKDYPKRRIKEIERLMTEERKRQEMLALERAKAEKDSVKRANLLAYQGLVSEGNNAVDLKAYDSGIDFYNKALEVLPENKKEIDRLISRARSLKQKQDDLDARYDAAIKLANDTYANGTLEDALTAYNNALNIKPDEQYPTDQIKEIKRQIAERDTLYRNAVAAGDRFFNTGDYVNAMNKYSEALGYKPQEKYPAGRIKEATQLLAENKQKKADKEEIERSYQAAIAKADKAFNVVNYSAARMDYQLASSLKPSEKYPKNQIAKIDQLLSQLEADRLNAQREQLKQNVEVAYSLDEKFTVADMERANRNKGFEDALKKADKAFSKEDYCIARYFYHTALNFKPGDVYCEGRVRKIGELLKSLMDEEEMRKYEEHIRTADRELTAKNYSVSRFHYQKALTINDRDSYPREQLKKIHNLVHQQEDDHKEFDQWLAKADHAMRTNEYGVARFYYNKALKLNGGSSYAKDQLREIARLTQTKEEQNDGSDYAKFIGKADKAFYSKDYGVARFYYRKAMEADSSKSYPREQLNKIKQQIAQNSMK
ncbi:hypothetical protein EYV94_18590 [Puteibacter caeruleilacunae]|nr:hypothetical protein EYV94_18590 [Puteibacter caeruleilacunae]